jgi:hypothetical protein
MNRTRRDTGKKQRLDALAFYLGAHGIDPEPTKQEIEAKFIQDTLEQKEEPLRRLHALEAKFQQAKKERPEAEALWEKKRKELGDTPPPYFHAVSLAIFGAFALLVDVLVLAPSMDMLGVADVAFQYVAAAGFAALFTAWFELCGLSYMRAKDAAHKGVAVAAGCMAVFTLFVWGLLRGHQLQFAAGIEGNPLGDFLGAHPVLASLFFILVTLSTPMVGAYSFLWAWRDYDDARIWQRVRERFESLRKSEVELPRQIEAEAEQLEHYERRKEAEAREWKEIFNHYYDRGRKNGARREHLWTVIWKSVLGAAGGAILAAFIPSAWFLAQILLPAIPGIGLFLYFNHRRIHPTPEQYLARENTQFAVIPDVPRNREISAPPARLLSKGEKQ